MLKILIILVLIGYAFYRITSFLFSVFFRGFVRNKGFENGPTPYSRTSRKIPNSNVNIDFMPKDKPINPSDHRSGEEEYVDFEEVK